MTVYLDASALVPLVVEQRASSIISRFVADLADKPCVSDFGVAEVGSALSRLVRMREITSEQATDRLGDFDRWLIRSAELVFINAGDVALASNLVRRFVLKLRTPDAIHLSTCNRLGSRLVTLDEGLGRAARDVGLRTANLSVE